MIGTHDFVAVEPHVSDRAAVEGPNSNTGLARNPKARRNPLSVAVSRPKGFAVGVDYCTLVFPLARVDAEELHTAAHLVNFLFPFSPFTVTEWEAKKWQFFEESAVILGPDGKLVGRVGQYNKQNMACVSLTGAGCTLVESWHCTVEQARRLDAHLSRIDLAFDDFEGQLFPDIREVNGWAESGRFDKRAGRPAETSFHDDHHKGKGSTVYVGSRGRKQLCIYEKGKQLKDKASPWIRCELRLWAADVVIPLDAMLDALGYLRGSYELLAALLPADAEPAKPERIARTVRAHAEAAVEFMRQQCGPTLSLLVTALGPDVWHLLSDRVFRDAIPRRFRGVARDLSELRSLVRAQLGGGAVPSFSAT